MPPVPQPGMGTSEIVQALAEMDTHSILPQQPLGDCLKGIIEVLGDHADRHNKAVAEALSVQASVQELLVGLRDVKQELGLGTQSGPVALRDRVFALEAGFKSLRGVVRRHACPCSGHQLVGAGRALQHRYFGKLLHARTVRRKQARISKALEYLLGGTHNGLRRVYLRVWRRWLSVRQMRRRRTRLLESLTSVSSTGLRRAYHRKAMVWLSQKHTASQRHGAREHTAAALASMTNQGLRRAVFQRFRAWAAAKGRTRRRRRLVASFMGSTADGLRRVYHHKVVLWTAQRVQRQADKERRSRLAATVLGASADGLRRIYHQRAVAWTQSRAEQKVREAHRLRCVRAMEATLGASADGLRRVYHQRALRWTQRRHEDAKRRRTLEAVLGSSAEGLRRVYHRRAINWLKEVSMERDRRDVASRRARVVETLLGSSAEGLRRVYLRKAVGVADAARRSAAKLRVLETLGTKNGRAHMLLRFLQLRQNVALRRKLRERARRHRDALMSVCGSTDTGIRRRYLRKIQHRSLQRSLVDQLSRSTSRLLLRHAYKRLEGLARRALKREQHRLRELYQQLDHGSFQELTALLHELPRDRLVYIANKADAMLQRMPLDALINLRDRCDALSEAEVVLRERCDTIGGQVDVSTRTLSNTNNVLSKLVDRMISIDEQLDVLDREVGKGKAAATTPVPAPAEDGGERRHSGDLRLLEPAADDDTDSRQGRRPMSEDPRLATSETFRPSATQNLSAPESPPEQQPRTIPRRGVGSEVGPPTVDDRDGAYRGRAGDIGGDSYRGGSSYVPRGGVDNPYGAPPSAPHSGYSSSPHPAHAVGGHSVSRSPRRHDDYGVVVDRVPIPQPELRHVSPRRKVGPYDAPDSPASRGTLARDMLSSSEDQGDWGHLHRARYRLRELELRTDDTLPRQPYADGITDTLARARLRRGPGVVRPDLPPSPGRRPELPSSGWRFT